MSLDLLKRHFDLATVAKNSVVSQYKEAEKKKKFELEQQQQQTDLQARLLKKKQEKEQRKLEAAVASKKKQAASSGRVLKQALFSKVEDAKKKNVKVNHMEKNVQILTRKNEAKKLGGKLAAKVLKEHFHGTLTPSSYKKGERRPSKKTKNAKNTKKRSRAAEIEDDDEEEEGMNPKDLLKGYAAPPNFNPFNVPLEELELESVKTDPFSNLAISEDEMETELKQALSAKERGGGKRKKTKGRNIPKEVEAPELDDDDM